MLVMVVFLGDESIGNVYYFFYGVYVLVGGGYFCRFLFEASFFWNGGLFIVVCGYFLDRVSVLLLLIMFV